MNKKFKRRIALFFISVIAVSMMSAPVFAAPNPNSTSTPATSTLTPEEQKKIDDAKAAADKAAADKAAADKAAADKAAADKAAADKAAADKAAASASAAKSAAQRAAWLKQQAAIAASMAAMSSQVDSSILPSAVSSSLDIQLPSVGDVSGVGGLTDSGTEQKAGNNFNLIGIVSLVCIGLGVLIVLAVLFSANRRPPRGGSGRTRYHKPRRSKKKRLLNDKYYRNMKY